MHILFILLWAALLLIPQMSFRGIGFIPLLVIYLGLTFPFFQGLASVLAVTLLQEAFSAAPHGGFILPSLIVYIGMQALSDRLYTEAYATKALWTFVFSFILYFLAGEFSYPWLLGLVQSAVNGIFSLPLFILLDSSGEMWGRLSHRRKGHLTGADLYQAQSDQRKYL
ncbi:MAG: hypothetical protein Q7T11_08065 [Deltaproteobacteria bacterium]|nr:hypothetical protein [Deltaproteobacteria bacterium]